MLHRSNHETVPPRNSSDAPVQLTRELVDAATARSRQAARKIALPPHLRARLDARRDGAFRNASTKPFLAKGRRE